MKKIFLLLPVFLVISCGQHKVAYMDNAVNSLIGDESYLAKFGELPNNETEYHLRIQTHLEYAYQLLQARDISYLTPERREKRNFLLQQLRDYITAGIYPSNEAYPGVSRPCFIDGDGRICAVGYLVEQSAGRELAEAINREAQYELLQNMDIDALDAWVEESGLALSELALIQPTYWQPPPVGTPTEVIDTEYGMFSGLFTLSNLSLSGVNAYQLGHQSQYFRKTFAWMGIGMGAGQLTWGILGMPQTPDKRTTFSKTTTLSWFNIGLGAGTMLVSGTNLLFNKSFQNKQVMIYPYSPKISTSQKAFGIGMIKTF